MNNQLTIIKLVKRSLTLLLYFFKNERMIQQRKDGAYFNKLE